MLSDDKKYPHHDPRNSRSRSRSNSNGREDRFRRKRVFSPVKVEESYNQGNVIYVSNINRKISDESLKQAFIKFGTIRNLNVIKDPFTQYCSYSATLEDLPLFAMKNWKTP